MDRSPKTDAYNKVLSTKATHGTLIENWQEEAILRQSLGISRASASLHIPKRHEDLLLKSASELEQIYNKGIRENTHGRIFGEKTTTYATETETQFTPKSLKKDRVHGKKYDLIQKQFLDTIHNEIYAQTRIDDEFVKRRNFDTTYCDQYAKKEGDLNNIGRRIMQDQNGNKVLADQRDEDLLVDHGLILRSPKATEEELRSSYVQDSYKTAKPYTFWLENGNDGGAYYKSSSKNQFGLNNTFVKSFHHYTHVKH